MKYADRVAETTGTSGTGTLILGGAAVGGRTFAEGFTSGDEVTYTVENAARTQWETGTGTYTTGSISRDTVSASSNGGALVDFGSGPKTVFATAGAALLNPVQALVSGGGNARAQILPQMLTVVCGNSIAATARHNTSYWNIASELHTANNLSGSPMAFGRLTISGGTQSNWNASGTGVSDVWGVYGYSGQPLATINTDAEANWFTPIITAGRIPGLVVGLALLENDVSSGRTVAQMTADLKVWMALVRRWSGVRILLCTPRPSLSNNTPTIVANWQAICDYMLTLDNGVDVFVARLNTYENPASPATPLSGYTDASVHPTTKGACANARVLAATLSRIAASWSVQARMLSANLALTGSGAASGTGWSGTLPTSCTSPTAASALNHTGVLLAEQPGILITFTQNAGLSIDAGALALPACAYAGGAATQLSAFAEVEIVSGAEHIRWVALQPRIFDGSGNSFQYYQNQQTGDGDGDFRDGDVLTMIVPPQVAVSGNISSLNPYLRLVHKTGGSGTNALATGTSVVRIRRSGAIVVVA